MVDYIVNNGTGSDAEQVANVEMNLKIDTSHAEKEIERIREKLEALDELCSEVELPDIRPIIYFNGCSFNFGDSGVADSTYKM